MDLGKLKKEQKIDIHLYLSSKELDQLDALKTKYSTSRSRIVAALTEDAFRKTFKKAKAT